MHAPHDETTRARPWSFAGRGVAEAYGVILSGGSLAAMPRNQAHAWCTVPDQLDHFFTGTSETASLPLAIFAS